MQRELTKDSRQDYGFNTISPKILYFGTPVVLVSSLNDDGTTNLAPLSSCWALGWTLVLGVALDTQTIVNLRGRPECVVNFPSPDLWQAVERLAPLTGRNPIPEHKDKRFRFESDKFGAAGLTPMASQSVSPPRVSECPAQLEGTVRQIHELAGDRGLESLGGAAAVEVEVVRVHVREDLNLRRAPCRPAQMAAAHLQLSALLWLGN